MLTDCLASVAILDRPDVHLLDTGKREPFTSSGAYFALCNSTPAIDMAQIWTIKLPTKIKFFAWLLFHGRLNTRAHLFHRNIKPLEESWCACCNGTLETDKHIFADCNAAIETWERLHITILGDTFRRPWEIQVTSVLSVTVKLDMILLVLWHIWKARNGLVFDCQPSSSTKPENEMALYLEGTFAEFSRILMLGAAVTRKRNRKCRPGATGLRVASRKLSPFMLISHVLSCILSVLEFQGTACNKPNKFQ